ncbi:MAG TPA: PadR family transcriptional regulator [Mesorhizobium sp.]
MSSIRLFILSSFAELGPMHGHLLRLEAERRHVNLWTDISVGAVYGAMKRMASEGLLREVRSEQEGNRPARQIFEITERGRATLLDLERAGLTEIWFKFDPFDLALARATEATATDLPVILRDRLKRLREMLAQTKSVNDRARRHSGKAKDWALRHSEMRLEVEIDFLAGLLGEIDAIVREKGGVV